MPSMICIDMPSKASLPFLSRYFNPLLDHRHYTFAG